MKSTTAVLNSYEMCYPYNHLILNIRCPKIMQIWTDLLDIMKTPSPLVSLFNRLGRSEPTPIPCLYGFSSPLWKIPLFHWLSCRTEAGRGIEGGTSQLRLSRCGRSGFLRFPLFPVFQHGQEKDNPPSTEVLLLWSKTGKTFVLIRYYHANLY